MGTLAIAFALVGIAVAAYGAWLGWEQHRLHKRMDALEAQCSEEASCRARSRAA